MFTAIIRFFGWDQAPPVRSTAKGGPRQAQGTAGPARPRPNQTAKLPGVLSGHDKSKADGREGEGKPAMAVIPRDAVQRMPRVASPGLPPVDPEERTIPPSMMRFAASRPRTAFVGVDEGARETESSLQGEPFLPFDPPLGSDSIDGFKHNEGTITGQVVAPNDDLDLTAFLNAVAPSEGSSNPASKDCHASVLACQGMLFLEATIGPCEHSKLAHADLDPKDCLGSGADDIAAVESEQGQPSPSAALGFDSRIETGLPRVTTPARPFPKRPQRVADRPRSEEWNDDELLTLPEAAALFWPDGPITTNTLRTAGRDGALAITKVAGKFFTTPMAIRRMGEDGVGEKSKQPGADEMSAFPTLQMKIAEAQRLGGGRARSRRAAKGPVTTAANGGSGR